MNPGGGGCSELRSYHCALAWATEQDSISKQNKTKPKTKKKTKPQEEIEEFTILVRDFQHSSIRNRQIHQAEKTSKDIAKLNNIINQLAIIDTCRRLYPTTGRIHTELKPTWTIHQAALHSPPSNTPETI